MISSQSTTAGGRLGGRGSGVWAVALLVVFVGVFGCRSTPPPEDDDPVEPEQPEEPEEPDEPEEAEEPPEDEEEEGPPEIEEEVDDEDDEVYEDVASHVDARIDSALSDAADGDLVDAMQDLSNLVDEPEGGFLAAYNLGVLYDRDGQMESAIEYYVEALQRQPDFTPALQSLIRLYLRAGATAEAEEVASEFRDRRPENLDHEAARLEIWMHRGRYEDVVEQARDILRQDVEHVGAMIQMATAKYQLGRSELAEAILERAHQLSPQRAEIYYLLAQIADAQDEDAVARANLRHALELRDQFPEARNDLAVMLHETGNYERAIGHLEQAIEGVPHYRDAWINLGNAHKAMGEYEEAENAYQEALEIDEESADALFNLGILYLEAPVPGIDDIPRYEKAIEMFQDYRDRVGQREASAGPVSTYISEASASIEDEQERQEALRRAQAADDDDEEDEEDEPADDEDVDDEEFDDEQEPPTDD